MGHLWPENPVAYGIAGPPAPSSQPLHGYPSAPAESQPTKSLGKVEVSTKRHLPSGKLT